MHETYAAVAQEVLNHIDFSPFKNKTVLVTGSNGLLGSHMVAALAYAKKAQNLNVAVTCMSRSAPPEWIDEILRAANFEFIATDLSQALPLSEQGFDFVIHAATYGQPKKFLDRPLETMALNSYLTEQLLKVAAKSHGSFLFMSSSEIYGNPPANVHPVKEEYHGTTSPIDQRAVYTASKRFGETLCKVYGDLDLARARIARVSSVYGPGTNLSDDRVLNVFIQRALKTGSIELMDHGLQKRRWLYISDAMIMLFQILLYGRHLVYNVSGDDLRSIAELATSIGDITGASVKFPDSAHSADHTVGAPDMIDIDNSRMKAELSLRQLTNLKDGLHHCVAWTKYLLSHERSKVHV